MTNEAIGERQVVVDLAEARQSDHHGSLADVTPLRHVESHEVSAVDDSELVAAAQDGSRDAFEELVRRHHATVHTLARRLVGNQEDAHDVVQEAFLRAYKGLGGFRGDAQFSTWMYRITANCAATQMGRASKHRHDELDDDDGLVDERPEHDPELSADAASFRERLDEAIQRLPPRLRAVVMLRDVYEMPHEAIAAELGITESAAKVRLHRARKKLKDAVFDQEDEA